MVGALHYQHGLINQGHICIRSGLHGTGVVCFLTLQVILAVLAAQHALLFVCATLAQKAVLHFFNKMIPILIV